MISPELRVADVAFNTQVIIAALREAAGQGCRLAVFPELCLTGYSCADLFYQRTLLEAAVAALDEIALEAQRVEIAVVVGLPLAVDGRLFNCAAFIADGRVLGLVPKTYLPSTNEFYEERWFTSSSLAIRETVEINGREAPFGCDLLFAADNLPDCKIGIEVCEDLWAVNPPSGDMALAGATILLNGSASNELLGEGGLPPRPGAPAIGALPGGLPLRRGRAGRVDDRHGVGRTLADRRERQPAGRNRAFPLRDDDGRGRRGRAAVDPRAAAQPYLRRRVPRPCLPHGALRSARRGTLVGRRAVDPAAALAHAVSSRRTPSAGRSTVRRSSASSPSGWRSGCGTPPPSVSPSGCRAGWTRRWRCW